jgi:hypothetical protein
MKKTLAKATTAVGLALALVAAGGVASASAVPITVTIRGATCSMSGEAGTYTTKATNGSCNRVLARIKYISSGGTTYTVNSASGFIATATAATSMVTYRGVQGSIVIGGVENWSVFTSL